MKAASLSHWVVRVHRISAFLHSSFLIPFSPSGRNVSLFFRVSLEKCVRTARINICRALSSRKALLKILKCVSGQRAPLFLPYYLTFVLIPPIVYRVLLAVLLAEGKNEERTSDSSSEMCNKRIVSQRSRIPRCKFV